MIADSNYIYISHNIIDHNPTTIVVAVIVRRSYLSILLSQFILLLTTVINYLQHSTTIRTTPSQWQEVDDHDCESIGREMPQGCTADLGFDDGGMDRNL